MKRIWRVALGVLIAFFIANLLYFTKSEAGVNLTRGHTGRWFPLGDWMWQRTLEHPFVEDGEQPRRSSMAVHKPAKIGKPRKPSEHDCDLLGPGERP
jgi:hypothetical protein